MLKPLTGLDSSFLFLETPRQPMHVGSVLVFEGSIRFDDFRNMMSERLHLVPRMRERLVMVPLGIGKPYWAEDPDFNIDMHLQHVALPRPGDWKELRGLAARLFSVPLDRSRPLWEMTFVEGLDNIPQALPGSVAMISKVHHAAIDGVSGADMLGVLLDMTREPRPIPKEKPRRVPPIPNELEILRYTGRKIAGKPREIIRVAKEAMGAAKATTETQKKAGSQAPPNPMSAPVTPFNHLISGQRIWNTALLDLDRVKAIKEARGCTLNDVVLAICAGALRRYLIERGALPPKRLVAMCPVSTRQKDQHGAMGNMVSAMLVELSTDVDDPIERLEALKSRSKTGKAVEKAGAARAASDLAEFIPFGLASRMNQLYSRFHVSELHNPFFNLVITNVPGPQVDLFMAGHKLLATMGMAPVMDGMGLLITVLSYNGVLSISPTSSPAVMPDLDKFTQYIREAANELEAVAVPTRDEQPSTNGAVAEEVASFVDHMRTVLHDTPEDKPIGTGRFQLRVTGSDEKQWMVDFAGRSVTEGSQDESDATLTIRGDHLSQILHGDLDPQIAYVQGKLRVDGDINKALEFGVLLPPEARA
ncbi:MAG: wax ester/triacylglycerol synthase family O-acyltransferase [Polyangiales bacterium]